MKKFRVLTATLVLATCGLAAQTSTPNTQNTDQQRIEDRSSDHSNWGWLGLLGLAGLAGLRRRDTARNQETTRLDSGRRAA